ncbi:MAG: NrfD/PsrC family molybdoenzyme membrane anchor subunit [Chloroflexota bacterium]
MEGDVVVIYNVAHQPPLGLAIAIYFYLTGLSAGSFMLSTLSYGFGVTRFKPISKVAVVMAVVLLGLAPLNLIADLGQPLRFWHLFPYLSPTSPITYGSFLLTLYPLNCLIYGFFMFRGDQRLTRFFGLLGLPLAVSVHGYTGFILALSKARALWNTALMPMLFLTSAMVSGIALMILVVTIKGRLFSHDGKVDDHLVSDLAKMLLGAIALDLFLIFSDVVVLLTADSEAREAALLILTLNFSPIFLGIELLLGSLLPIVLLLMRPRWFNLLAVAMLTGAVAFLVVRLAPVQEGALTPLLLASPLSVALLISVPYRDRRLAASALAAVMVMVGIMAMRYIMVIGGQSVPLS